MRICATCQTEKADYYAGNSRDCKDCVKDRARRWYAENQEHTKRRVAAYAKENPDKVAEWRQQYEERHKDRVIASKQAYVTRHPERRVTSRAKWNDANRERIARVSAAWQRNNRAKASAGWARYNAAKKRAVPGWANEFFISEVYDLANRRSQTTGFPWHVDHMVPLVSSKVCGLHVEDNLRVIPGSLNMKKSNRTWPDMP